MPQPASKTHTLQRAGQARPRGSPPWRASPAETPTGSGGAR